MERPRLEIGPTDPTSASSQNKKGPAGAPTPTTRSRRTPSAPHRPNASRTLHPVSLARRRPRVPLEHRDTMEPRELSPPIPRSMPDRQNRRLDSTRITTHDRVMAHRPRRVNESRRRTPRPLRHLCHSRRLRTPLRALERGRRRTRINTVHIDDRNDVNEPDLAPKLLCQEAATTSERTHAHVGPP